MGVRNISSLETPPEDRLSVETRVTRWNDKLIRNAILRELNREGQVYFVHNRVKDIRAVYDKLKAIVPEASIEIGHGQMKAAELEDVMVRFVRGEFDVLLATTIVESGLDIPNANTIFIDDADRYGLADLHQLRGRVGRYKHRAYSYLLVNPNKYLSKTANRRLRAIEEYSEMGAGFAIAMRDLELRGAGNILGTEQSGHIEAIGYELYCQLLDNAIRRQNKMPPKETVDVSLDLPGEAFLPDDYVPDMRMKIDLYRRLSRITRLEDLTDFAIELTDRFGPPRPEVRHLVEFAEVRILAQRWQISSIHTEDSYVVLRYTHGRTIKELARRSSREIRVVDASSAYVPADDELTDADATLDLIKSVLRCE